MLQYEKYKPILTTFAGQVWGVSESIRSGEALLLSGLNNFAKTSLRLVPLTPLKKALQVSNYPVLTLLDHRIMTN